MKKLNLKKSALLIVLSFCLTNCIPHPPDVPVCESLTQHLSTDPENGHKILQPSPVCMKQIYEAECGHCTYIVSGKEIYVGEGAEHLFNKKKWSQLKTQSILVPAEESYAPLSAYIIDSCKKLNCSDQITPFKVKVDALGRAN